jgi:hypothetical protein
MRSTTPAHEVIPTDIGRVVHSGVQRTIEYQRNLPDHWRRRSLRGIALPTNNASNVYTVVNGRIDIEEYCACKVLRNFGRAFNFPAVDFDTVGLGESHPEQEGQECRLLQHIDSVGMVLLVEGQVKRATVSPSPKRNKSSRQWLLKHRDYA